MLKVSKICALTLISFLALIAQPLFAQDTEDMVLNRKGEANPRIDLSAPTNSGMNASRAESLALQSSSNIRLAGLLFVLLGACGGATVLYYKRRRGTSSASGSPRLNIVERLPFGPNREFVLLKACDRMLVVAAHGNQIVCLTDMATDLAPVTAAPMAMSEAPGQAQDFGDAAPLSYESLFSQVRRRAAGDVTPPARAKAPAAAAKPAKAAPVPVTVAAQENDWPEIEGADK